MCRVQPGIAIAPLLNSAGNMIGDPGLARSEIRIRLENVFRCLNRSAFIRSTREHDSSSLL
jgi:hypothetical protein